MPLDARVVGCTTEASTQTVDARWLMAYAAALDDLNPGYLDTHAGAIIGHPVFPVCLEWPAILASRHLPGYESVTAAEGARGVHASHDLHVYRPVRAEDRLTTRATVISLAAIRPGAALMTRLDTTDAAGELVCRTYQLGISRGVGVTGEAPVVEVAPTTPAPATGAPVESCTLSVSGGLAHIYSECARIWNPIHTDRAVALAAGLPDIILHGTATMALAVTAVVDGLLGGDSARVRRLGGRFAAVVRMPSTLTLNVHAIGDGLIRYQVLTEDGEPAFRDAFLYHDPPAAT